MLDHVSITVSDIAAAERFYDAIMKTLEIVKVGRRDDWLGYGERARPGPIRTASISPSARARSPRKPSAATGASRRSGAPRWTRSGTPALPPAAPTTARRVRAIITRRTTPRSCATLTATGSRRSATTRYSKRKNRRPDQRSDGLRLRLNAPYGLSPDVFKFLLFKLSGIELSIRFCTSVG